MTIKHLVIPGGGPMGIQAIGALQHLEESGFWNKDDIKTIYATSAGAIISLLIALKFDWDAVNDYIILRPWHETYNINIGQIFEAYSKKGIFDKTVIEIFYKPFFATKDLSLNMTMVEFYKYSGVELHFFSLEMNEFKIVDISYKTFPDIPVIQAVQMSCAIPMVIAPVCFDNKCYVDGGIISNYPINYCIENEKNVEEIFGIQNIYQDNKNNIVKNESTILDYLMNFIGKLLKNASDRYIKVSELPYELKYEATYMNFDNMKEALYSSEIRKNLVDKGINAAKEFLSELESRKQQNDETVS